MLTPEELRDIPDDVAKIFEECEDSILRLIAERIIAIPQVNTATIWQLINRKESMLLRKDVARVLARYTGMSEKEIRKIFRKAGALSLLHDEEGLKGKILSKSRKRKRPLDRILQKTYAQTNGTFHNWTRTTASNVSSKFVHAMDKAALQVQSGAFSYDEAIRMATRDLADHMDYVQYPSGHRDTLEVASRRAVRTGVNQMASRLTLQQCKDLGIEFVETTAHAGARTSKFLDCRNHSWWQGKVFHLSKEGARGEDGKFYPGFYSYEHAGYGYGDGICGWNCRHSFHPFIPGVSEQVYTAEELDKLNEKVITYNGRELSRYEADQYQRSLERNIRKYKRRYVLSEAVGDQKETERNMSFIRKWSNELERFTRVTGIKRDYERERETVGQIVDASPQNDTDTVESVAESRKNVAKDDIIVVGAQKTEIAGIKGNLNTNSLINDKSSVNDSVDIDSDDSNVFGGVKRALKSIFTGGKVLTFDGLPDTVKIPFEAGLKSANSLVQKVISKIYKNTDYVMLNANRSYYSRGILDYIALGTNVTPGTIAHELFHRIDKMLGISPKLLAPLLDDYAIIKNKGGTDIIGFLFNQYPNAFTIRKNGKLVFKDQYRGISDIIHGLSQGNVFLGFGHPTSYWQQNNKLERESWAQFGRIIYDNDPDVLNMFTALFPKFNKQAMDELKNALKSL